jgi:hypothetical protein
MSFQKPDSPKSQGNTGADTAKPGRLTAYREPLTALNACGWRPSKFGINNNPVKTIV